MQYSITVYKSIMKLIKNFVRILISTNQCNLLTSSHYVNHFSCTCLKIDMHKFLLIISLTLTLNKLEFELKSQKLLLVPSNHLLIFIQKNHLLINWYMQWILNEQHGSRTREISCNCRP